MQNLTIKQSSVPETVSYNVVHLLYETILNTANVDVSGVVLVKNAYADEVAYLNTIPNFTVIVTDSPYIRFENSDLEKILIQELAPGLAGITVNLAASITLKLLLNDVFKNNSHTYNNVSLQSWFRNNSFTFNELKYFTDNTILYNDVFIYNKLTDVDLSNITAVGSGAFKNTSIITADLKNKVTTLGDSAYNRVSTLTSIINTDALTSIGGWCFENASITSAEFSSITYIGEAPFLGSSIRILDLGALYTDNTVTKLLLGRNVFYNAKSLTKVILRHNTVAQPYGTYTAENVMNGLNLSCIIYVPDMLLDQYKETYSSVSGQFAALSTL